MKPEELKILKKLVSLGYGLQAQHNNDKWRKALEDAEDLLIEYKNRADEVPTLGDTYDADGDRVRRGGAIN